MLCDANKCINVAFDSGLQSGYLNCCLFNSFPPPKGQHSDLTFLYLDSLAEQYHPPPPKRATRLSGGVIAAIVLGLLAFIAVTGLFWRQAPKRNSKLKSG
jgi:hypothetical protein